MDETVLIALGILIEETTKGELGKTGDFALVEAARSDEEDVLADEEGVRTATSSRQQSEDPSEQRSSSDDSSSYMSSTNSEPFHSSER
jgi:hypothetical protein